MRPYPVSHKRIGEGEHGGAHQVKTVAAAPKKNATELYDNFSIELNSRTNVTWMSAVIVPSKPQRNVAEQRLMTTSSHFKPWTSRGAGADRSCVDEGGRSNLSLSSPKVGLRFGWMAMVEDRLTMMVQISNGLL
jgi:hypothetical protein